VRYNGAPTIGHVRSASTAGSLSCTAISHAVKKNRLEVWDYANFRSPMESVEDSRPEENVEKSVPEETVMLSITATPPSVTERIAQIEIIDLKSTALETDIKGKEDIEVTEKHVRVENEWKQFNQYNAGRFTVRRPTNLTDGSRGTRRLLCVFGHYHYYWGLERAAWQPNRDEVTEAYELSGSDGRNEFEFSWKG
jgi:hypothetical protein